VTPNLATASHEFAGIRHSDEKEGERTPGDFATIIGQSPPGLLGELLDDSAGSRFWGQLGFTVLPHGLERPIKQFIQLADYFYEFSGSSQPV